MGFVFLLFCEAFLSLYWAFFVFKPIANMLAEIRTPELFWGFNIIRVFILIYFDFFASIVYLHIFLVDFILMIIGAVALVPIVSRITHTVYDRKNDQIIRKDERKNKAIGKDESLRDRFNIGGFNRKGSNNDGDYSNRVTLSNHSKEGVYMNRETNSSVKELCTFCGEEVESTYIYCPYCGHPIVSKMIQDTDGFK